MESITDTLSVRFSSLQELEHWYNTRKSLNGLDTLRVARDKLDHYQRTRQNNGKTDLKLMVCHDYKGNYQPEEDENPQGYFPHSTGIHYFLQFPSLVDQFIYFSHNRVSVPPVSWINALHRQGIPVLGTVLIEGTQHKLLDELVVRDPSDNTKFRYVAPLVELANHYGFDGWLINIESVFSVNTKAQEIILFVEALRSSIHLTNPHAKIVWYDAFIAERNRIFYQNGVNEHNYDHFESTDQFFTNYWWDENTLRKNILNVGLQGVKKKLYTGIDVWGRGSKVGNGGFETGVAINFLRVYSSNIGLFAPAWTYENFPKSEFITKDRQFWIDEDANPGGSIATYIPFQTAPVYTGTSDFNFYTNFSQGEGEGYNVLGIQVYDENWVNGSLQTAVPTSLEQGVLEVTKNEKFNGGSSLKVALLPNSDQLKRTIELFQFQNDITSGSINVSISFKAQSKLPADSSIKLIINYYIERRYRSVTRVRDGTFEIPLKVSREWKLLETSFQLPRLPTREHFVLSGAKLEWRPEGGEDINESWIVVPNESTSYPIKHHKIFIGDLLIESNHLKRTITSIRKVEKTTIQDDEVFVQWADQQEVLHWLVYVNSKFVSATTSPGLVINRGDRLRVDCFTRSSQVISGVDIFI